MTTKALVIVHGIGEQRRGETTEKLVRGLKLAYADQIDVDRDGDGRAVGVEADGVRVRFHEVYWADLLSREANRGALTWSTLPTLVWQPLVCRRAGLLPATEYPTPLVATWLAATLVVSLLAYPLLQGARFFAQIFDRNRQQQIDARVRKLPFWARGRAYADAAAHEDTMVEVALQSVAADVPTYMNSIARGTSVAGTVLARFHDAMRAACAEASEVQVLSHSLGTVIAYHALTGLAQPAGDPPPGPSRLFTIGSPLEKIRYFWPWTVRRATPSAHPDFRWLNFYHRMDTVSGRLWRFAAWAPVENVRLRGGGGLFRSHVVYERSPEFLGTLTGELFGERRVPRLSHSERLKDRVLTAAENLAAPAITAASLAFGLAVIAAMVLGFPYLFSRLAAALGAGVWANRIGYAMAVMPAVSLVVLVIAQLRQCYRDACTTVSYSERSA